MKTNPTRLIMLLPMMLLLASCSNEELENANVKLTEDLKKKDEELQKNKKELQTKIDDLQQQVDAATLLQEQIAILTNERDGLKAEQELNAQNMLETDVQMGVLQSELKDATIRIEDLTAEVKEANITISRLGSGVSQPQRFTCNYRR